jgi:hypothetical protein
MRCNPILLKPTLLFVFFQKGNKIHNQFLGNSAVIFSLKKMGPIVFHRETAHHTPIFKECNGLSWKVCGFSALHILLVWLLIYPHTWNHAPSQQKTLSKMSVPLE